MADTTELMRALVANLDDPNRAQKVLDALNGRVTITLDLRGDGRG